MNSLLMAMATLLALSCAACRNMEPPYRAEVLAFNEKLLGTWVQELPVTEDGDPQPIVRISKRDLTIKNGRIERALPDAPIKDSRNIAPVAHAYTLRFGPEGADPSLQMSAFLLRTAGRTFVGVQLAPEIIGAGMGYAALPVHVLWLADHTDDRLSLREPKNSVVWVPGLRSIDPPAPGSPDVPANQDLSGENAAFTPDIDRLLRIYGAHAKDASFWSEPRTYRRLGE